VVRYCDRWLTICGNCLHKILHTRRTIKHRKLTVNMKMSKAVGHEHSASELQACKHVERASALGQAVRRNLPTLHREPCYFTLIYDPSSVGRMLGIG
jgi:hypothetical protein